MNTAWSSAAANPGTNLESARSIARKLCRDSLAWAKTFVVHTGHSLMEGPGTLAQSPLPAADQGRLEEEMFAEVLAYGLCLLEMRGLAARPGERDALIKLVRHECRVLIEQAEWRRKNRHPRLPAPVLSPDDSRYAHLYPACGTGGKGRARYRREIFEQFCRCTGLGSDVLVGKGENLATLIFYVAIHGVLSAGELPTNEAVRKLLQAARQCHTHLQGAVSEWVAAEPNPLPSVNAQQGGRSAIGLPPREGSAGHVV